MFEPTDIPLHRRSFLQQASIFGIWATLGRSICVSAFAQDATASIATRLGTSIANQVGSQVASLAFGQIMSAIGVDTNGAAAMQAELDQIITDLQVLQGTVEAMKSELEVGLANLNFSGALAPVLPLIAANEDIAESFRVLLSLSPTPFDNAETQAAKRTEIEVQKRLIGRKITPTYEAGLQSWNNAIQGLHGQPSLIKTWSTLVAARSGDFFGWKDAQKVQSQWDFIDGHQALTATFLIDFYDGQGARSQARAILMDWYRGRRQQLPLLRGVTRRTDRFTVYKGSPQIEITDLDYLPEKTLIQKAPGLMWYLEAQQWPPELHVGSYPHPAPGQPPPAETWNRIDLAKITGRPRYHPGHLQNPELGNNQPPARLAYTDPGPWFIPDDGEFQALVSACGGALHTDNDKIMGPMQQKGFVFPQGKVGVFTRSGRYLHADGGWPPFDYYRNMYREDTNALEPADWHDCCESSFGSGWGGTALVQIYRRAIGDEAYWYSP